jgi:protein-disulfide isomerase
MEPQSSQKSLIVPISIIIGFAFIAVAIYLTGSGNEADLKTPTKTQVVETKIRPVDSTDFIRGNPNAPIMIVEYSDYDCSFCKSFHETLDQVLNEYGVTGKVAWVYRQFPISSLHPNSPKISEAALCVGDIAGNDAFWNFTDKVFNSRDYKETTNITKLSDFAEDVGVDKNKFNICLESGKMKDKVQSSYDEAISAGLKGTPHTFITVGNQQAPIEGSWSYEVVKATVENLISQLDGTIN